MTAGKRHLIVAALLLAGCGTGPAQADGPTTDAAVARIAADYQQCRDAADGAAETLACADTAIAWTTIGDDAFPAFLRALGDHRLGGDPSLAQQVVVADAATRFALARAALPAGSGPAPETVSPPSLPPDLAAGWKAVRAASCAAAARPDCLARADALLSQYLAATSAEPGTPATTPPEEGLALRSGQLPTCAALIADRADPQTLLDRLERTYPAAYADPARVDAAVAPDAVAQLARSLACYAGLTGYDAFLADQAVALFASPRHGEAAFAALDAMAAEDGPQAQFAREFASQMRDYI